MVILVADDDRLVRFTMKSLLGDILGDSGNVFLEAANGRDMVQMCKEWKPDVAFVDIHMPYLNGLEAIEECKKHSEYTEYVVVSGYSEFAYAQKGIHLGVTEYLLKPVDEEQLRPMMEQLKEKQKRSNYVFNARFQLQVMEVFNYYSAIGWEEYEEKACERGCVYLVFLLYIKSGMRNRKESVKFQKEIMKKIRRIGEGTARKKGCYGITYTAEGTICIIFGMPEGGEDYVMLNMRKISMAALEESVCYYIQWTRCETLKEVYCACEKMDEKEYLLMGRAIGSMCEYIEEAPDEEVREFLFQIEKLLEAWELADGIVCREVINVIWRKYKETGKFPDVDRKNLARFCSSVCGFSVDSSSWKLFFTSFVEHSEEMYQGIAGEERDVIEEVKKYIQRYYQNDISISQIADQFGLTANYLSTLFHRKTGGKFIDYLTKTRIEAAKKLLVQNVSATVQDVALMVGYNSTRHFSSLFQKQTGEIPSLYRKNRRQ